MPEAPIPLSTFTPPVELRTGRVLLRPWRESDLAAWVEMNADPEVRRYFPNVPGAVEATAEANRIRDSIAQRGWGLWAVEIPGVLEFAGFNGLIVRGTEVPWGPAVEAGWRLCRAAWGHGYASEGAAAALRFAFEHLNVDEVVAVTVPTNTPSRKVMERIGMQHPAGGYHDHPKVPDGSPLKRHILYRVSRQNWVERT